ncbi:MAG: sel1 repeat family protein [Pseudomonadota bacterium]
MARFDINSFDNAALGSNASAEIIFEMGLAAASGRDRDVDLIEAHKWFNIAAIKGSTRAAALRSEIAETMTKADLAKALRDARQWMTQH